MANETRNLADFNSDVRQLAANEHELAPTNAKRVVLVDSAGTPYSAAPATGTVAVSGTVSVSGTTAVSGTVGVSGTLPVSGTVSVGNFPATQAVSGSVTTIRAYQANLNESVFVAGTSLPASGGTPVLVFTTTRDCNEIRASDTTGEFIGLFTSVAATTRIAVIGPGMDGVVGVSIPSGTTVFARCLGAASGTADSFLALNFVQRLI